MDKGSCQTPNADRIFTIFEPNMEIWYRYNQFTVLPQPPPPGSFYDWPFLGGGSSVGYYFCGLAAASCGTIHSSSINELQWRGQNEIIFMKIQEKS